MIDTLYQPRHQGSTAPRRKSSSAPLHCHWTKALLDAGSFVWQEATNLMRSTRESEAREREARVERRGGASGERARVIIQEQEGSSYVR